MSELGVPKSQPNKKSQDWDFSGKNLGIFWDFLGFFKNFQINWNRRKKLPDTTYMMFSDLSSMDPRKSSAQLLFTELRSQLMAFKKVLTSCAGGQKLEVGILTSNQTSIIQID